MRFRHSIYGHVNPRGLTPRRLAAARRALARERSRYVLFADQLDQESPEERITKADLQLLEQDQACRNLAARHWKWGRRQLARLPWDIRRELIARWNRSWIPPTAAYFADFVRSETRKRNLKTEDDS